MRQGEEAEGSTEGKKKRRGTEKGEIAEGKNIMSGTLGSWVFKDCLIN